ncbi:MAG: hypothetical protein AABX53_02195 [Nanoarchaeota archaeon]
MTKNIETLTEKQREIYDVLRSHPNGAREAANIALSTPGDDPTESARKAQLACVNIVETRYNGNAEKFLRDYAEGKITRLDIIIQLGRKKLGLAPATPENRVYN